MNCPACGKDCVKAAHDLLWNIDSVFAPCPECRARVLNKRAPLPNRYYEPVCSCGKRFIDEVFAHIYVILEEEGLFSGTEPLAKVGMPLVHPGFFMPEPPYLPPGSLLLVSGIISKPVAIRIANEVPEIRGIVKSGDYIPGIAADGIDGQPKRYEILAGCDVRANIFPCSGGPVVLYQQQSLIHIEFPRNYNPKIDAVEKQLRGPHPPWFVDAACGAGTLGLVAARIGTPHVILNDAWYAAAFWTAFNLDINMEFFAVDEVIMHASYGEMETVPVRKEPMLIAETEGKQTVAVYQGDLDALWQVLPDEPVLTVLDLFDKENKQHMDRVSSRWREHVSGEVFIP
ncbi:MAG TPA: hypothetical protein VMS89_07145 [Methanoregulaceae archaeon]|nr:hypothetical protein [Methanoregulaceae archaeon]